MDDARAVMDVAGSLCVSILRHVSMAWADGHLLRGDLPVRDVGGHPGRGDCSLELGVRPPVGHARDGRTRGA